jgi:tRNA (adenine22-N1)-methyltransferase
MKSLRLLTASKYIKGYNCLVDVGTDHAKLPIFCIEQNYVKKAYASDNKPYPLENAKKNIEKAGLESRITTTLVDGLKGIDSSVDIASILGMGGRLIVSILEEADLRQIKRLVLSANSENYNLREFLMNSSWQIIDEELVKENNKFYQIIVSEPGTMHLNDIEKEFGPIIIHNKSIHFQEMIMRLIKKLANAINNTSNQNIIANIQNRIQDLEEVIK